ncbi:MAG: response regulator [Bdellovibrionaceae bacterium]|nr:response regulator [Pseudobdellovibrionaceae bacterium]
MKILLIDDEPDVVDLLQMLISMEYADATVFTAVSGQEGLQKVYENPDMNMVFCDYNMPQINGGGVFVELRKKFPRLDFILVSSENPKSHPEFNDAKYFHHIEKPFSDSTLYGMIKKIMTSLDQKSAMTSQEVTREHTEYIPLEIELLHRLNNINCSLYLKISDNKFVKVIHPGTSFTSEEMERFQKKEVETLFVDKKEFVNFMKEYKKNVFSKMAWDLAKTQDKVDVLSENMSLLKKMTDVFGWSEEAIKEAQENISTAINVLKNESSFEKLNELLKTKKNLKLVSHTFVLTIMLTEVIKRLGWDSHKTIEKLTFASLLHDVTLNEDLFADKQTMYINNDFLSLKSTLVGSKLFSHPIDAANLTLNWSLCPPDVDVIIRQHHERPDGLGFPMELAPFKISPLSAVFIVCEDLIYQHFVDPDLNLSEYFSSKKDYYGREPFRPVFNVVMEMLKIK